MDEVTCPTCGTTYPDGTTYCDICCAPIQELKDCWEDEADEDDGRAAGGDANENTEDNAEDIEISGNGEKADCEPSESRAETSGNSKQPGAENDPDGQTQCPSCGDFGTPGEECRQCGKTIPSAMPEEPMSEEAGFPEDDKGDGGAFACNVHEQVDQVQDAPAQQAIPASVTARMPDGTPIELPVGAPIDIGRESNLPRIRQSLERYSQVSRNHCTLRITQDARSVSVIDRNSLNGTWIDDRGHIEKLVSGQETTCALPARIRLGQILYLSIG